MRPNGHHRSALVTDEQQLGLSGKLTCAAGTSCAWRDLTGVVYDPLRDRFRLSRDPAVNDMRFATRG